MNPRPALNSLSAAWACLSGARSAFGVVALSCLSPAHGLEIGAAQMLSGLGQPLSLQLPVRWAPGELRSIDCLKLKVQAGDSPLAAVDVQQRLLKGDDAGSALIWVRSKIEMAEPVLVLTLGCPAQQVMALVDPVHSMVAPSSGAKATLSEAEPMALQEVSASRQAQRPPVRATKVRAERVAPPGNQLRLSLDSLPPLSLADSETPGLRWRFDSDLEGSGSTPFRAGGAKPPKDAGFTVRRGAPGASLLMAIDVGRPAGPADLLMAQDGPERLARAQAQFADLQAAHLALKLELDKLAADVARRDAATQSTWQWLIALGLGLVVVAAGVAYRFRANLRRR